MELIYKEGTNELSANELTTFEFNIVCNPEKPFEEYIIVLPKDYKEELTYQDYCNLCGGVKG